jgi:hypothetical protein
MLLHLPPAGDRATPKVKNGPPVTGRGAEAVKDAIVQAVGDLPEQLRRSLTWDQGAEMAQHARLRIDTGLQVYFCALSSALRLPQGWALSRRTGPPCWRRETSGREWRSVLQGDDRARLVRWLRGQPGTH